MTGQPERGFEELAADLEKLEAVVATWPDEQHRGTVSALRRTLEALHREALAALVRRARALDGGLAFLRQALEEPAVAAIFQFHGLVKAPPPSLEARVQAALESVRPTLAQHDGDVVLVAVDPPEVRIRMIGSCHGCAHSEATVKYGIEDAVKAAAPEIERVVAIAPEAAQRLVPLRGLTASPFEEGWEDAGAASEVPEGKVLARELKGASVLLTRAEGEVRAFANACTHLGMPLDGGDVVGGVLTCPYHGFSYLVATGECLTAPETQLARFPARVDGGRVRVDTRVEGARPGAAGGSRP